MPDDTLSYEQDQRDFTTLLKDGMILPVKTIGEDGHEKITFVIDNKSAYWKTHNINSYRFGLLAEAVEYLDTLGDDAEYNMSKPRAEVIKKQINAIVHNILKKSIDAKSSETMRDGRNAQTSLTDKYLKRKQETVLDVHGEVKKSVLDSIFGKKAEQASD